MARKVEIVGAPGYADRFPAEVALESFPAVDGRGDLTVIITSNGEYHVVPSSTVHSTTEGEYEA